MYFRGLVMVEAAQLCGPWHSKVDALGYGSCCLGDGEICSEEQVPVSAQTILPSVTCHVDLEHDAAPLHVKSLK